VVFDIGLGFLLLSLLFLVISFYSLFFALSFKKKYYLIKSKVSLLKSQNNSRFFIEESLINEGFDRDLVFEVVEEVFFGSA